MLDEHGLRNDRTDAARSCKSQMMTTKWTKRMARSRMLACYQNVQIALDLGKFRNSPWTGQCSRAIVCLGIRWAIGQIAPGPSEDRIDHSPKLSFRLSHLVQSASESFLRTLTVDGNPCDVPSAFDERKIFIDRHSWLVRIKCKSAQDCLWSRSARTTRPVFDSEWQDRDIAQASLALWQRRAPRPDPSRTPQSRINPIRKQPATELSAKSIPRLTAGTVPKALSVRIHEQNRRNRWRNLRVDNTAQLIQHISKAGAVGDHLQRPFFRSVVL
jgi:hypothetical protein